MSHDDFLDQLAQSVTGVPVSDFSVFLDALADSGLDLSTISVADLDDLCQNTTNQISDHTPPDGVDRSTPSAGPMFSGYGGGYGGITEAWYSSDGYVYDPAGNRIGTH